MKKPSPNQETVFCGTNWARTSDTRIFSPLLYQLSYGTAFLTALWLSGIANVVSFFVFEKLFTKKARSFKP